MRFLHIAVPCLLAVMGVTLRAADAVAPTDTAIKGSVLASFPETGVVLLNIGSTHQVKEGQVFYVYRKQQYLGKIRVENARSDLSETKVIEKTGQNIDLNDDVSSVPLKTEPAPAPVPPPVVVLPRDPAPAPPVPVVQAITAADCVGSWIRRDQKITWRLDLGGAMVVREREEEKISRGTWTFDAATGTLFVNHGRVQSTFSVSVENGQFVLIGTGTTNLRFSKLVGR